MEERRRRQGSGGDAERQRPQHSHVSPFRNGILENRYGPFYGLLGLKIITRKLFLLFYLLFFVKIAQLSIGTVPWRSSTFSSSGLFVALTLQKNTKSRRGFESNRALSVAQSANSLGRNCPFWSQHRIVQVLVSRGIGVICFSSGSSSFC